MKPIAQINADTAAFNAQLDETMAAVRSQGSQDRCLLERLAKLRADWRKAQRWGLRFKASLPALSHEQAEIMRQGVQDALYNTFDPACMDRNCAAMQMDAIDRARDEYRLRAAPKASKNRKIVRSRLYQRDGGDCWLCGKPMTAEDRTIEHLTARQHGGGNGLDNTVLTHAACNRVLANMSLGAKHELRSRIMDRSQ